MASLTLIGRPSGGGIENAAPVDVMLGSNFESHPGTPLILNATTGQAQIRVAGTSFLSVSPAAVQAQNGSVFAGYGSGLIDLNASNLTTGLVARERGGWDQDVSAGLTPGYVGLVDPVGAMQVARSNGQSQIAYLFGTLALASGTLYGAKPGGFTATFADHRATYYASFTSTQANPGRITGIALHLGSPPGAATVRAEVYEALGFSSAGAPLGTPVFVSLTGGLQSAEQGNFDSQLGLAFHWTYIVLSISGGTYSGTVEVVYYGGP